VTGVEHTDNKERRGAPTDATYCTTMRPDECPEEEKSVRILTGETELVLRAEQTTNPRHESPSIRCCFGCESLVGSCTNSNCVCYNPFTGQGQLLWVGVCLQHSFDRGLAWCPLTLEFGSTGLKRAMQAKRLNVRKASEHAGFQ